MMMKGNYQDLPVELTHKIGPLLIALGLVSILQAAGAFPLGTSSYPEALILLCLGGMLSLGAISKSSVVAQIGQGLLAVCTVFLILLF